MLREEMPKILSDRNVALYEFYRTHSAEQTASEFGLSKYYVYNLVRRIRKMMKEGEE